MQHHVLAHEVLAGNGGPVALLMGPGPGAKFRCFAGLQN